MREPRPGIRWSGQRVAIRARYVGYMESPAWYQRRRVWLESWRATHDGEPNCVVCGEPWTLHHGHLHHRNYRRLGNENPADLIPLCCDCHARLHAVLELSPAWRHLDRAQATDMIVAMLRRRAEMHHG